MKIESKEGFSDLFLKKQKENSESDVIKGRMCAEGSQFDLYRLQ